MNRVSIVIPIYNASKYLSICLDSVITQTYNNIEIIAVDDKSTDTSLALLEKYKKKCKHLKIVSLKKNGGVSRARNKGIESATGDYIFFIDSDDFIDKDAIFKMVDIAEKYDADVVDTERLLWYKRGKKILTFTEQKKLHNNLVLGNMYEDSRSITMPRYVTGKLYKRSVIDDVRFDEKLRCYEDALFNHQIKKNFTKYVFAKDVFYHYLQRPSSLINTISLNHLDYLYAGKEIAKIYEQNNIQNQSVKKLIDSVIASDVLVILGVKIPKMKTPITYKKQYVKDFINLVETLSISKWSINLFKNNFFISTYYAIIKHLNLIDLTFLFLSIKNGYKIKDERLIKKVNNLYRKMD